MSKLHGLRQVAHSFGLEIRRFPQASPEYQPFRAFVSKAPDVILDVGANDGGFAHQARMFGYEGDIVSFEPGSAAFGRLSRASRSDRRWEAHRLALGAAHGEATLNIAANEGHSSSLLPMLEAHRKAAPDAQYVDQESVPVRRLVEWYPLRGGDWLRPALKIDAQGFEREVLIGAQGLLDRIVGIRIELSLADLYDGSWTWREATDWLEARGFALASVIPGFTDPTTGRMLQFDGVFLPIGR